MSTASAPGSSNSSSDASPASPAATTTATAAFHVEPTVDDAQDWNSVVLDYSLRFEPVALDISSRRVLYHLKLELEQPIPSAYLEFTNYLCLGWPLGGIWKITKRCDENRFITCVAWRKTELSASEIAELAKQYVPTPASDASTLTATAAAASIAKTLAAPVTTLMNVATETNATPTRASRPPPITLFDWKMQLGTWRHQRHWFVREVGLLPAKALTSAIPSETLLSARLFAGLAPVEVSMVVNAITAVDTVAQRFTADVTWELTLRGITAVREDSVLRELLDLIELKDDAFEFSNATDVHSEKPLVTVLAQESERIQYCDPFVATEPVTTQRVHQLKYSRRLVAEFSEEMTLYNFPFDQQKLSFTFSMSKAIAPFLAVAPRSGDPGHFALEHFKLRNVWQVVCGDKLFIGDVVDSGTNKNIRFEMLLERRSAYYLTNVGLPAAIITYLCFISYAPLKLGTAHGGNGSSDGDSDSAEMMDTGARLQIVLTLLLTAVTFKYNLASLLPQVSYFTTLDKYVFVCFIITCAVAVENAVYPLVARLFGGHAGSWKEYTLGWVSVSAFTLMNVVWAIALGHWIRTRSRRTRALLLVNEYVRAIASAIPNGHKEHVLRGFLRGLEIEDSVLPQFFTTKRGDLFVKLPSDSPSDDASKSPYETTSGLFRKQALRDLPAIQRYFKDLDPANVSVSVSASPTVSPVSPAPSPTSSPVATPVTGVAAVVAKQYGAAAVVVNIQDDKQARGA